LQNKCKKKYINLYNKCFAIVCSHTDNVSEFVDTFHEFIRSSHSQSITTASHATTQSQHYN